MSKIGKTVLVKKDALELLGKHPKEDALGTIIAIAKQLATGEELLLVQLKNPELGLHSGRAWFFTILEGTTSQENDCIWIYEDKDYITYLN